MFYVFRRVIFLLGLSIPYLQGATLVIDPVAGLDQPGCGYQDAPACMTIGFAAAAAAAYDILQLVSGSFVSSCGSRVQKPLEIVAKTPGSAILECVSSHALLFENAPVSLHGLVIRNSHSPLGLPAILARWNATGGLPYTHSLVDCTFENNAHGGVLLSHTDQHNVTITVNNCHFSGNSAGVSSGAASPVVAAGLGVLFTGSAPAQGIRGRITRSMFHANRGSGVSAGSAWLFPAGAIASAITVDGCEFRDNAANITSVNSNEPGTSSTTRSTELQGGFEPASELEPVHVLAAGFCFHAAGGEASGNTLSVIRSSFVGNSAARPVSLPVRPVGHVVNPNAAGLALAFSGRLARANTASLLDCVLARNTADGASGVGWSFLGLHAQHNTLTITACELTDNSGASLSPSQGQRSRRWIQGGAALSVTHASSVSEAGNTVNVTETTFARNKAGAPGSAIFVLALTRLGEASDIGPESHMEFAEPGSDSEPDPGLGSAAVGDASLVSGLVVSHCDVTSHEGDQSAVSMFSESGRRRHALLGLDIVNTNFVNNTAAEFTAAGALLLTSVRARLQDTWFVDNSAPFSGGAILLLGGSDLTCERCLFQGNSAGAMGNDIVSQSVSASPLRLLNCTVSMDGAHALTSPNVSVVAPRAPDLAGTLLLCPPGSVVSGGSGDARWFGCKLCPPNQYVVAGGSSLDGVAHTCLDCPYGGDCTHGGDVVGAQRGFWGQVQDGGGSVPGQQSLRFELCPEGYCCGNQTVGAQTASCFPYNSCNLDRDGLLCARCRPGFSETFGSAGCRPNAECHASRWFVPLCLLLSSALACFLLLASAWRSAALACCIYFLQLAPELLLDDTLPSIVGLTLVELANMRLFIVTDGVGVCLFPDMDAVQEWVMYMLTPLLLFVCLGLAFVVSKYCLSEHLLATQGAQMVPVNPRYNLPQSLTSDDLADYTSLRAAQVADHSDPLMRVRLGRSGPIIGVPLAFKMGGALTAATLFVYAAMVRGLCQLILCVDLPIDGGASTRSVLYLDARIECYQPWQQVLWVILVLLGLLPFALALLTYRLRSRTPGQLSAFQHGVLNALATPYRDRVFYWESVQLLQRFVFIMFESFFINSAERVLALMTVLSVVLLVHVHVRPFRYAHVQNLQTLCVTLLLFIAGCSWPATFLLTSATVLAPVLVQLSWACAVAQSVMLPAPLVVTAVLVLFIHQRSCSCRDVCRRKLGRNGEREKREPEPEPEPEPVSERGAYRALPGVL